MISWLYINILIESVIIQINNPMHFVDRYKKIYILNDKNSTYQKIISQSTQVRSKILLTHEEVIDEFFSNSIEYKQLDSRILLSVTFSYFQ